MNIDDVELYKIIGQTLKARREKLGMSQEQLAAQVNVGRTSIVNIETGRQRLPLHLLYDICIALDMPDATSWLPRVHEIMRLDPKWGEPPD